MPISQILLEELKQLKTVYVCMKKIMEYYGSIRIGELGLLKFEDQGVLQFLLSAPWLIMNMVSTGIFIRQVVIFLHGIHLLLQNREVKSVLTSNLSFMRRCFMSLVVKVARNAKCDERLSKYCIKHTKGMVQSLVFKS